MCDKCGPTMSDAMKAIFGDALKVDSPLHKLVENRYDLHAQDLAPMFEEYESYLEQLESPALAWLVMAGRVGGSGKGTEWIAMRMSACMALALGAMRELDIVQEQRDLLLANYEPTTRKAEEVRAEEAQKVKEKADA